ncbi:MAG: hypothetical protein H8E41_01385 [Desulfobulbaceae bacterium]|uniref:Uncharacterized protein n=1 Tax=Candidatus Desulfobia pelagia TaxID=2841692 RepID=A0A8J6NDA5_9BACT|nr:hypothetical protein [Candidatus Desulfobia pelagia]
MKLFTTLILTAILFTGCGYTNPYAVSDADGTDERVPLYLEMWKDNANQMGYQNVIQQSLVHWLKKSKSFVLVRDRQDADHILSGIIHSVDYPGLSYGTYDRAIELRAKVQFSYTLEEKENNTVKLKKKNFTKLQSFMVGTSAVGTNDNKELALREIAEELAEEIYIELSYLLIPKKEGA